MKTILWRLAEFIEARLPRDWKRQLLRRWLTQEMISKGWKQPQGEAGRLCRDELAAEGVFTLNMADHEAISRHFKEWPLR